MVALTWNFTNNALDNNGAHPWIKMSDGSNATVSGGALSVTTTGYVCDISDLDMSRKWRITFNAKCQAADITKPTYFFSVGPVLQNSSIGGFVVYRPAMSQNVRLDDSPCVADYRRIASERPNFQASWFPPFELTYDPTSDVRKLTLYHEGIIVSTSPIGNHRDPDTSYRYLYIGQLLDSSATPCSFDQITLDTNWSGTPSFYPVVGLHTYYRVRLYGACTLLECGLDTVRSTTTDDGVSIRTNTLTLVEGSSADPIARIYDKLYEFTYALTPNTSSGWSTIEYTEPTAIEAFQLRLGAKSTDPLPTWVEIQYSNDGLNWFLEDRFRILPTHFQISGTRANCVATYQRNIITGKWEFIRNFSTGGGGGGGGGSFANTKSINFDSAGKYAQADFSITQTQSVSVWIKIGSSFTTGDFYLFALGDNLYPSGSNVGYAWHGAYFYWDAGVLNLTVSAANSFTYIATTWGLLGSWHNLTFVWDYGSGNGNVTVYLDGVSKGTNNLTTAPKTLNAPLSFIGTRKQSTYAANTSMIKGNALLDEISIWNKALSSGEITAVYNSGTPGDLAAHSATSNLVSWYRFEASDGTDSKGTNTLSWLGGTPSFTTDVPTPPVTVLTPHNRTSATLTSGWYTFTHNSITQRIKTDTNYDGRLPWHVLDGTYTWAQMTATTPNRIGWMTNTNNKTGVLTYDLGQSKTVTKVTFWNYGEGAIRCVLTYIVRTSLDDTTYTQVASGSCAQTPNLQVDISFSASNARYVQLEISNTANSDGFVGINEFEITGY